MKIIEETRKQPEGTTEVRFVIVGDRKEGSMEIPIWENRLVLSDSELVSYEPGILDLLRRDNARSVFNEYYNDTFITPSPEARD